MPSRARRASPLIRPQPRRASPLTPPQPRHQHDDGSAALEFLTVGLGALVPIVYLVLALSAVQSTWLASEGAARAAAGAIAGSTDSDQANAAIMAALAAARLDDDRRAGRLDVDVDVDCGSGGCFTSDALVTVRVRVVVELPVIGPFVTATGPARVESVADQRVSRFRVAAEDAGR